jgi:D-tyrosyl-tRNA(Tyr) deacylase
MIALIQRVTQARVTVGERETGRIGRGLLALVCAQRGDGEREADALIDKVLGYRVFGDAAGRMNLSVRDVGGGVLMVPQFTLAADTASGTRPSFSPAAPAELGRRLFERCLARARAALADVASGQFGAHMQVELVNDGPVTFWLQVRPQQEDGT